MQIYIVALATLQLYDYMLTLPDEASFGRGSSEDHVLTGRVDSMCLEGPQLGCVQRSPRFLYSC